LQNREISHIEIQEYFSYFHGTTVRESLNEKIQIVPSIFYAVATNDIRIVKLWVNHGGDVNAVDERCNVPLLAFAILHSVILGEDTTSVVILLLANGAKATSIPPAFSESTLGDLPPFIQTGDNPLSAPAEIRWCNEFFWKKLGKTLNISQRYYLRRARRNKQPSVRLRQAATQLNVTALFGLPFSIIGQDLALQAMTEHVLSYLVLQDMKPLVLMFAGTQPFDTDASELNLTKLYRAEWTRQNRTREKAWISSVSRNPDN